MSSPEARNQNFESAKALFLLGLQRIFDEQWSDAERLLRASLERLPDRISTITNLCATLIRLRRFDEAQSLLERGLAIEPSNPELLLNQGLLFSELGEFSMALALYDRALALRPNYAEAWYNKGNSLSSLWRHADAHLSYSQSIRINPGYPDAHWNMGLSKLRLGEFEEGWRLYEWRWRLRRFKTERRDFQQPLWLGGQSLDGKTILLHAEQGFGDTIQFCRYASSVKKLGAKVILEAPEPLMELLRGLAGVDVLVQRGKDLPIFDYQCPLLSLPLALQTSIETIPAEVPYLFPDPAKSIQFETLIRSKTKKPMIGLVWSGDPKHKNDRNRSIALTSMHELFTAKYDWISLKKELTQEESQQMVTLGVQDFSKHLQDFSWTAALVNQLDLVISVDTSVAHLAGALGKPVWILVPYEPDFRWMWNRTDSPWYPTAQLFRQPKAGDWSSVLVELQEALSQGLALSDESDQAIIPPPKQTSPS